MTRAVAAMAGNHVAANLLMLLLVLGGLYAAGNLRQDIFPDARPETINVVVAYPGATPAEVEDAIVLPIELAVAEVDYIRRVRSSAREGVGAVASSSSTRAPWMWRCRRSEAPSTVSGPFRKRRRDRRSCGFHAAERW